MIYIMDASAGIEIALDKEGAAKFRAKFHAKLENATTVISSDGYKVETANVIWKYFKANLLNKEEGILKVIINMPGKISVIAQ